MEKVLLMSKTIKQEQLRTRRPTGSKGDTQTERVAIFDSGAKRSQKKLPRRLIPQEWKQEMAKRFLLGWEKYGLGNCYTAMKTGDLDFIREFWEHADDHLAGFLRTIQFGPDTEPDGRKEGPMDHMGAAMWNCGMLITYYLYDRENTLKAFNSRSLKTIADEKKDRIKKGR